MRILTQLSFAIIERPHGICARQFALCGTTSFSSRVLVFFKVPENSTFHVRMGSMGLSLIPPPEKVSSSSLINLAIGSQFPLNKSPCGVYRRKVVLKTSNIIFHQRKDKSSNCYSIVKTNLWFSSYFMRYDKYFQCVKISSLTTIRVENTIELVYLSNSTTYHEVNKTISDIVWPSLRRYYKGKATPSARSDKKYWIISMRGMMLRQRMSSIVDRWSFGFG